MTDLIQEIEKATEKASKTSELFYMYVDGKLSSSKLSLQSTDREQARFIAGAQFILPLLKAALSQRDLQTLFHCGPDFTNAVKLQIEIQNQEIIKLLGSET